MTDQYVAVLPDAGGKKIDTSELVVAGQTVERQRVVVGGANAGDLAPVDSVNGLAAALQDMSLAIRALLVQLNRPMAMDPATSRLRVVVESVTGGTLPTVTTVTTVSTVTNLSQIGGQTLVGNPSYAWERTNWAQNVRLRIA